MKQQLIRLFTVFILMLSCFAIYACGSVGYEPGVEKGAPDDKEDKEENQDSEQLSSLKAYNISVSSIGPDTTSAYLSSFREVCGEDMDAVFFGKPRKLKENSSPDAIWTSSDDNVATVSDGIVTGWKEGIVTITETDGDNVQKWDLTVTTFNDGRYAEISYELGEEGMDELFQSETGIPTPEYLQFKINTIKDAVTLLRYRKFFMSGDLPILANVQSNWMWSNPPETVLDAGKGGSDELSDAISFLLCDDFEKCGFFRAFGKSEPAAPWFYEDGYYYLVDVSLFGRSMWSEEEMTSYGVFKTGSKEELGNHFISGLDRELTLAVVMIETTEYDFMPPVYRNYQHNYRQIPEMHCVIGMEDEVLKRGEIVFINPDYDVEIKAFPSEEVPDSLDKVGTKEFYEY